jgi:hypothetical protein
MNQNTVVDALKMAGVPLNTPVLLTNPGGVLWLFTTSPTGDNPGTLLPVVLNVPNTSALTYGSAGTSGSAQAPLASGPFSGTGSPVEEWYADGNPFLIRAAGTVRPNAFSKTFKLVLFSGNGQLSTATGYQPDVQIGSATATTPASVSAFSNWYLEARCVWDSYSLQLNGVFSGMVCGTIINGVAFTVNNLSANVPLAFVLGCNLPSGANAQNDIVSLEEFSAEML